MSGFAFSHQFSKRWLATPAPIKHAIIQELDDIVTLLQSDTDLEHYQFSVPNLNDKVEELLAIECAHQEKLQAEERLRQLEEQQRLEAERLQQQRLEAQKLEAERLEQERLENERIEKQTLEAQRLEQQAEAERLEQERLYQERQAQDAAQIAALEQERAIAKQAYLATQVLSPSAGSTTAATDTIEPSNMTIERHSSDMIYAIDNTAEPIVAVNADNKMADQVENMDSTQLVATPDIEKIKQAIVKQLQGYIDNYLLESMTFLNDDLNKWLKTEVEKQLNERLPHSH